MHFIYYFSPFLYILNIKLNILSDKGLLYTLSYVNNRFYHLEFLSIINKQKPLHTIMSENVDVPQTRAWLLRAANQTTSGDLPEANRIYRYVLGILQTTSTLPVEWRIRCENQIVSLETILTQQTQAYTHAIRRTLSQELDELMEKFYQEGSYPITLLISECVTSHQWN